MDSAICAILTLLIAIFAADSFSVADDDGNGSQLMAIDGNGWMVKRQKRTTPSVTFAYR